MTKKEKKSTLNGVTPRGVGRFFADLGPGLITGAADDDPSGISTYSVTGASFGYAPLCLVIFRNWTVSPASQVGRLQQVCSG